MRRIAVFAICFFLLLTLSGVKKSFAEDTGEDLKSIIKKLENRIKENTEQLEYLKKKLEGQEEVISEQQRVKEEAQASVKVPKEAEDTGPFAEAKLLLLTPRGIDIDVAIIDWDTDNLAEGIARGIEFDTLSRLSTEYTVGYQFKDNSRLSSSYWHLDTDEDFYATEPNGGKLWVLLGSGTSPIDDPDSVSSHLDFEIDVLDLEYTRPLFESGKLTVSGLIGLRYARIEQDLRATYVSGSNTEKIKSHIETNMLGPKIGVIGRQTFIKNRFFFEVDGSVSLLAGNADATYSDIYSGSSPYRTFSESEYENVFPVYELDVGFGFMPAPDLEFRAGYLVSYWTDVLTHKQFVDDVQEARSVDQGDSVAFDGIVFSVRYVF